MPVFDAIYPTEDESVAAVQPRLFGRRLADLGATAGGAVWVALASPVGSPRAVVLVLPWLGSTGAMAAFGLWRLGSRGPRPGPLPELAIDAALLYVPVGAVALFAVAVAGFVVLVLRQVVPRVPRVPGALLAVASLAIVATMALAVAYGYSAFPATGELLSIGEMIRWHGSLNAFGFALPALLAFRLTDDSTQSRVRRPAASPTRTKMN